MERIDCHNLLHLLRDIIRASLKATPKEVAFGHPCSYLIDNVMDYGLDNVVVTMVEDKGEFRLNGAGLKFYVSKDHVSIGGDQEENYPDTVEKIRELINKYGMGRKR